VAGVVYPNNTEVLVSPEEFHRRVQKITDLHELAWYGLESTGLLGDLGPSQLKVMMSVCAEARGFHIVSYCKSFRTVNRFMDDAAFYYLARGDKDPYLTFNPWINPNAALLDEDVFAQLGCELHDICRRLKR